MAQYVAAIDCGTTGAKAIIFDTDGAWHGTAYQEYPCDYPAPNRVEQDAEALFNACVDVLARAVADSDIDAGDIDAGEDVDAGDVDAGDVDAGDGMDAGTDGGGVDGGTDAGFDGGTDAGAPDAGFDAGAFIPLRISA